ncbi:hypothetical protein A3E39_01405 [Candidatus Uhrbacteria bacterium RIFCSPHIGHO2_12_FULL_60_25]|uniref:CopG family transcriptional regulator n=1 Tax=Candidatus Uhrbacteria bacterium RIFCSPHIGHO2_12_FULL_60_25 TaxID=1802399 RepID=A0A1F7UKP7_9BACT|nr:MAG: hypothetical protein A3D73_03425 [Candidatus Uhrbacteria bacterium RIFCSPHIGHO2_02_FULL_60_44]OGL78815.1 MAG: hypothetical protein A3E39_01405 [Candidatus Uhrbacteria bacterium RIFCSPHIGHO2_12_FULL_60_25]
MYKAPTCGCCEGYIAYLKHEGFDVTVVNERLPTVKERYRIPSDLWSCHTTLVEGYAVEGHVPFEVIRKLLDEKPSFDAIALPAMPSGTPGMPGPKRDPWKIYSVVNGVASEYMTL